MQFPVCSHGFLWGGEAERVEWVLLEKRFQPQEKRAGVRKEKESLTAQPLPLYQAAQGMTETMRASTRRVLVSIAKEFTVGGITLGSCE